MGTWGVTTWSPIETLRPYEDVLLFREGDLYPVVGWAFEEDPEGKTYYVLEEGGQEDDEARQYPLLTWVPTHWALLPETPP